MNKEASRKQARLMVDGPSLKAAAAALEALKNRLKEANADLTEKQLNHLAYNLLGIAGKPKLNELSKDSVREGGNERMTGLLYELAVAEGRKGKEPLVQKAICLRLFDDGATATMVFGTPKPVGDKTEYIGIYPDEADCLDKPVFFYKDTFTAPVASLEGKQIKGYVLYKGVQRVLASLNYALDTSGWQQREARFVPEAGKTPKKP